MGKAGSYILLVVMLAFAPAAALHAQKYPERKHIRSGNKEYRAENYPESEVRYMRALVEAPGMYEAEFNLANAFYKQERYEEAAKGFVRLAESDGNDVNAAGCYYNAGNSLYKLDKLKEALEAYKQSLRINPSDMDAKFNYAYVKKLLKDQEGDGGGGGNDENKDDQDNKDQDQNKDQKDGDDKGKDQDKGDDRQDKGQDKDKPQGQDSRGQGMNREEADQMLEAIQAQEDKTQEKVDEKKKGAVVVGSKRNW